MQRLLWNDRNTYKRQNILCADGLAVKLKEIRWFLKLAWWRKCKLLPMSQAQNGRVANFVKIIFCQRKCTEMQLHIILGKWRWKTISEKVATPETVSQMQISQVIMFSICLDISNKSKFVQNIKIPVLISVWLLGLYYSLWYYQFSMMSALFFPNMWFLSSEWDVLPQPGSVFPLCLFEKHAKSKQASTPLLESLQCLLNVVFKVWFWFLSTVTK